MQPSRSKHVPGVAIFTLSLSLALAVHSRAHAETWTLEINDQGRWKIGTQPVAEIRVQPGDEVVWKNTGGTHGLAFPDFEQAQKLLDFKTDAAQLKPLSAHLVQTNGRGVEPLTVAPGGQPHELLQATVKAGLTSALSVSFHSNADDKPVWGELVYPAYVDLRVSRVTLNNPPPIEASAPAIAIRALLNAARSPGFRSTLTGAGGLSEEMVASLGQTSELTEDDILKRYVALQEEVERLREQLKAALPDPIKSDGQAIVVLAGNPNLGTSALVKFLETQVQRRSRVALIGLHHPSLQINTLWFDELNEVAPQSVIDSLRLSLPPFDKTDNLFVPGRNLKALHSEPVETTIGVLLGQQDQQSENLHLLQQDGSVKTVNLDEAHAIIPLPEDDQLAQAVEIAAPYRNPNARSVLIKWEKPKSEAPHFELTYQQKSPKWHIEYRLLIQDQTARIQPWAFIYNRTAYEWEGVPVTLRQSGQSKVEYTLADVSLGSQQAGLFPVAGEWQAEVSNRLLYDNSISADRPLHTIQVKELKGPYLVPGTIAAFSDGLFLTETDATTPRQGLTINYRGEPGVTVKATPDKPVNDAALPPLRVIKLENGILHYNVGAARKYELTNKMSEAQKVILKPLEGLGRDFEFDGQPAGKEEFEIDVPPNGDASLTLTRVSKKATLLDLRTVDIATLAKVALGPPDVLERFKEIVQKRQAIKNAQTERAALEQRLKDIERTYLEYPVVTVGPGAQINTAARSRLQAEIARLVAKIGEAYATESTLQAEIDALLFGPQVMVPPPAASLYHGVFAPVSATEEDIVSPEELDSYEATVGKRVAFALMPYDLRADPEIPRATMDWMTRARKVPYVRVRVHPKRPEEAGQNTLDDIIQGRLDPVLIGWGRELAAFGWPVLVDYGPECNGHWNSWCGIHNGGAALDGFGDPRKPDGPERFVAAFRRVVQLVRDVAGARNVTWVFHVQSARQSIVRSASHRVERHAELLSRG